MTSVVRVLANTVGAGVALVVGHLAAVIGPVHRQVAVSIAVVVFTCELLRLGQALRTACVAAVIVLTVGGPHLSSSGEERFAATIVGCGTGPARAGGDGRDRRRLATGPGLDDIARAAAVSSSAMTAAPDTAARDDAVTVVGTLRAAGHVAYFAGGCVRDTLLGRVPKDYDVATDAPPDRVRRLFRNTQAVGAAFGVVLVRVRRTPIEVATFRTDGAYTDGRRPDSVRFATAEEDAKRRDFTINGLFLDPMTNEVIDHVGGRADLDAKLIRAIANPDERFAEDHLRLLRAIRFAARLGFEIEPATADAIRRHAGELSRISPERVTDELRRILCSPSPGTPGEGQGEGDSAVRASSAVPDHPHPNPLPEYRERGPEGPPAGWRMLWDLGLAAVVFRFLQADGGGTLDPARSLFRPTPSFGAAVAAAVLDYRWQRAGRPPIDLRPWLTKAAVAAVGRAVHRELKVSNDEAAEVTGTLGGLGTLLTDPVPGVAGLKRFLATPTAADARALLDAAAAVGVAHRPGRRPRTRPGRVGRDRLRPAAAGDRRRPDGRRGDAGAGVQAGVGRGVRRAARRTGGRPGSGPLRGRHRPTASGLGDTPKDKSFLVLFFKKEQRQQSLLFEKEAKTFATHSSCSHRSRKSSCVSALTLDSYNDIVR